MWYCSFKEETNFALTCCFKEETNFLFLKLILCTFALFLFMPLVGTEKIVRTRICNIILGECFGKQKVVDSYKGAGSIEKTCVLN